MAKLLVYHDGSHYISCLQLADNHLRQNRIDETNVRWIVIGLHDALYALLIEKLARTDGFGIYNKAFEQKVEDFYRSGLSSASNEFNDLIEKSSKANIASIGGLLQRAKLTSGAEIKDDSIVSLDRPSRGISHLKEMRNFLAHPRPMLAGYHEDWLLDTLFDTIEVIQEVADLPAKTSPRHDPNEAKVLLNSIKFYLGKWRANSQQTCQE